MVAAVIADAVGDLPGFRVSGLGFRVLEYSTLVLCLVLDSCYSHLYLASIYFVSRVYSKVGLLSSS